MWSPVERDRVPAGDCSTNLLNPKIAAFYVGVLSGARAGRGSARSDDGGAGAAATSVLGVIWLGICTLAVAGGRSVLGRPSVRRWLDRVTGAVLLGFAARLVLDGA